MRIAIISPNRDVYSETFIRAHIERLQGVELVLTEGHLPHRDRDGRSLLRSSFGERMRRRALHIGFEEALKERIAGLLRKHAIQVVLAEYGPTGDAMLEVCRRANVPMVVHFHGIDAFHDRLLKDSDNYARVIAGARALVVVSREMERQLLTLGCPREKLHYNCYGIDIGQFARGDPASAPPTFISVGRFVDKKAPHLTLLAFQNAWQRDRTLRLTMVGNGPLWESTRQMAAALGMNDVVELAGVLEPEEIARRLRTARAYVQHSVITADHDHEGTPLAVLEAMACGLPVIATRHGGIPDVVEHDRTGLLCEERDLEAMASHIMHLAGDPAQAARMGAEGRRRMEEQHRIEDRIAALQAILEVAAG